MTGRKAERKVRTKERTLEINKKSDTVNSELRDKLFIVLALTGCVSNIAGFTANAVIFGFTPQTLFCAACALVILSLIHISEPTRH